MADNELVLLISRNSEAVRHAVRDLSDLSDRVRLVTPDDLRADTDLWPRVEAAYGWLSKEDFAKATGLKWLQIGGAGANGVLTPEFKARDVTLTNVSGIHAQPITEHMFGMLLQVTRALPQAVEQQKTRKWRGFDFGPHVEMIAGKTLGILGVGAIGGHAARVGKAFEMKVVGLRRSGESHPDIDEMFATAQKREFFARCDVVMNVLPLTDNTRGFMGPDEFAALPQGAIVINAGRGPTIDTNALMDALRAGKIRAALLDVTDPEPLPADHPLWTLPGVFITPHYSGSHPEYEARAAEIFLDNLKLYLAGEPLHHVVNKGEGY